MAQDAKQSSLSEPCPVCAAPAGAGAHPRRHRAPHNGQTYTLRSCTQCRLQFWSPLRCDPSVYEREGFDAYVDYHSGTRPFPRWAEPLFATLDAGGGRALDIGCGDGAVLRRLASHGWTPTGIDLDPKSIDVARSKYGLDDVAVATLDAYVAASTQQGCRFDLITFFEVLEHQDAPRTFLRQVASLAAPGARIAGSVPNRERFLANLDRKLSDGDLPPHHFLWFSADALAYLLVQAGFADVSVRKGGALGYRQIVAKLGMVAARKLRRWPTLARVLAPMLYLAFVPAALLPWLGMRAKPSHLFFICRSAASHH